MSRLTMMHEHAVVREWNVPKKYEGKGRELTNYYRVA